MKKCFLLLLLCLLASFNLEAQIFSRQASVSQSINSLYRKATKDELKKIAPSPKLFEKYAGFLRQPNTGLTKLAADVGCAENTKIVVATDECLKYTMPGAGFAYSFRTDSYRIPRLADLIFTDNSFQAAGIFLHGIFVNIGDVPLDKVTLQTNGLEFLVNFQPEVDYAKAKEIDRQLTKGIEKSGFLYRRGLYTVENTTFVLRSIAYQGKYFQTIKGVTYNEFAFDKRKDIIVAFRIVQKYADESVTILWKELARKNAPRIKKKDRAADAQRIN